MKKWVNKYDWGTFKAIWDMCIPWIGFGLYIYFLWMIVEKLLQ